MLHAVHYCKMTPEKYVSTITGGAASEAVRGMHKTHKPSKEAPTPQDLVNLHGNSVS